MSPALSMPTRATGETWLNSVGQLGTSGAGNWSMELVLDQPRTTGEAGAGPAQGHSPG